MKRLQWNRLRILSQIASRKERWPLHGNCKIYSVNRPLVKEAERNKKVKSPVTAIVACKKPKRRFWLWTIGGQNSVLSNLSSGNLLPLLCQFRLRCVFASRPHHQIRMLVFQKDPFACLLAQCGCRCSFHNFVTPPNLHWSSLFSLCLPCCQSPVFFYAPSFDYFCSSARRWRCRKKHKQSNNKSVNKQSSCSEYIGSDSLVLLVFCRPFGLLG